MIIDLQRFIDQEGEVWRRLEAQLDRLEAEPGYQMSIEELAGFHHLYQKTAADLTQVETFAAEWELLRYLEGLVSRAYAEIHETRDKPARFAPFRWFFRTFPQTFRRHIRPFWFSLAVTIAGCIFGAAALAFDSESKSVLMPFGHLMGDPKERVAREESAKNDRLAGHKGEFSAMLMTHNTRVSVTTMALGMTWGIGTLILLFFNGVILGAVTLDYVRAGQTPFLVGWLLPHGSVEIPAIILAGQAGFILAGALIGWRSRLSMRSRLRQIAPDLVTLIFGVGILLIWAGFIESFLSQYHQPVIPYWAKIAFGSLELITLTLFLARSGRRGGAKT